MTSRAVPALVVALGLFGSRPLFLLEGASDERDTVAFAHAAILVAGRPVTAAARAAADAWRLPFALPASRLDAAPAPRPPLGPEAPLVHAAVPDVVTCPSQGPPV